MENRFKNYDSIEDYIFIGCMFIGMGIGEALNAGGIGTLVGMGCGFLIGAVYHEVKIKK